MKSVSVSDLRWLPQPSTWAPIYVLCAAVALVGVAAWPSLGFSGLLVAGIYGTTIALGASIFIAINAVVGAKWWAPTRGTAGAIASAITVPAVVAGLAAVAAVALGGSSFLGEAHVFPWSDHALMESNHVLHSKAAWLEPKFFAARTGAVVVLWVVSIATLVARLRATMASDSSSARSAFVRTGAVFILLFGVTISVGFWDWTMSLEPEWFSTMYGVYGFAGAFQAGIAAVTVGTILGAKQRGVEVPANVLHDLGKLLFGFSMFWAYIWFSQFMLIWYANIPEETLHFNHRLEGGWGILFGLNVLVNFALPFFALLSQRGKKNVGVLFQVAVAVLVGHWLDVFLLVEPSIRKEPIIPVFGLAATVAILGVMLWRIRRADVSDTPAGRAASH